MQANNPTPTPAPEDKGTKAASDAGSAKQTLSGAGTGVGTKMQKKQWRINSINGEGKLEFSPVFEVSEDTGDVETRYLELTFLERGNLKKMVFNWLDIYMFVYFTCNEELRRNLAARYERQVNYIPYDVTMKVTKEEWESNGGMVKRRVQLPVDELQMAIARNEAFKMMMRTKDPRAFRGRGR